MLSQAIETDGPSVLPNEIIFSIVARLNFMDVLAWRETNLFFSKLLMSDPIWVMLLDKYFKKMNWHKLGHNQHALFVDNFIREQKRLGLTKSQLSARFYCQDNGASEAKWLARSQISFKEFLQMTQRIPQPIFSYLSFFYTLHADVAATLYEKALNFYTINKQVDFQKVDPVREYDIQQWAIILSGSLEKFQQLSAATFNPNLLAFAIAMNRFEITEYLIQDKKIDVNKTAALNVACSHGHKMMVQFLLNNGADLDKGDDLTGFTPVMQAVMSDQIEIVDFLTNMPTVIDQRDKLGRSLIELAAGYDCLDIVKLLIKKGKTLTQASFVLAVKGENLDIVLFHLQQHCEINWNDRDVWSAIKKMVTNSIADPKLVAIYQCAVLNLNSYGKLVNYLARCVANINRNTDQLTIAQSDDPLESDHVLHTRMRK